MLIHQFRNIRQADMTFSLHLNCFIGDNGSGKTSLLEALYTLGHGKAFRSALTSRVISHDCDSFTLHARLRPSDSNPDKIGLFKHRNGEIKVKINEDSQHKIADLAKCMPMQLITPEGFDLIAGGPKFRRAFLDWGAFHHYAQFYTYWSNLRRIIKQRNAALKQGLSYQQIRIWDKELIGLTAEVTKLRRQYCEALYPTLKAFFEQFLSEYEIKIHFYPGWNEANEYAELLEKNYERDRQVGFTNLGAHKADLRITVENLPIESVLSRGQLKLLMCAMRLAQGAFFSDATGRQCAFLLDDFSSELDKLNRAKLANALQKQQAQIFITALNKEQIMDFIDFHDDQAQFFYVVQGQIQIASELSH